MTPVTAEQIELAAETLTQAADALREVAHEMRSKQFPQLWLQADTAFNYYTGKLYKVAMDAKTEFRDQYMADKMGVLPRWKIHQKWNEARDQAKADRETKGIEPPPVKKTTKKPKPGGK